METIWSSPTHHPHVQTENGHAADAPRSPKALSALAELRIPSTRQALEPPPDAPPQTLPPFSPAARGSPAHGSAAKQPIPIDSPESCCESRRPHPRQEAPLPAPPPLPVFSGSSSGSRAPLEDSPQARAPSCS